MSNEFPPEVSGSSILQEDNDVPDQEVSSDQDNLSIQSIDTSAPSNLQQEQEDEEPQSIEEQARVVYSILKPVAVTMCIVIWLLTTLSIPGEASIEEVMVYHEKSSDSSGKKFFGSIENALVFVAMVLLVTCLFLCLYKFRCMKILYAWLLGSTGLLMGSFGSFVFYLILQGYNLPLDWITYGFVIWNFTVGGLVSIFWYAPTIINQAYLVVISALMAVFFSRLPEWTTFAVLAFVAIYDLFAVLCPHGPLKVLVETAQERQEPIPALLYSGSIWIGMADNTEEPVPRETPEEENVRLLSQSEIESSSDNELPKIEQRKSVKLGLGDFVFYSVLVGRAAMFDVVTIFSTFIGIITGLFMTLFLLAIFRRALPALPISIALGMIFFFISRAFLLPIVFTFTSNAIFL